MNNKEFKKLKNSWYEKLKKSGFEDIEYKDGSLKSSAFRRQRDKNKHYTQIQIDAVQAYYRMAFHFLHEYEFESEFDRIVWEYHTNGIGTRSISKLLQKVNLSGTSKTKIWLTVKKLREIMKRRYLQP